MNYRAKVIVMCEYLLPGRVMLSRRGEAVWMGPLSAPWEDVDYDVITLPDGRKIPIN